MESAALVAPSSPSIDLSRIAQDLQIRKIQVEAVVQLLDEGNTVPFITRYRKERTGGLNEDHIRRIKERVEQLRHLADRKATILKSIDTQGKLTDELRAAILAAETPKRLEDLYLPYKPKKRSLASDARDKGLEPLALAIWTRDPVAANLDEILAARIDPDKALTTADEVKLGVQHILAELIAETADVRGATRRVIWETGKISSVRDEKLPEAQARDYQAYFQFEESIRTIPAHRILALNRGEKENALKVTVTWDNQRVHRAAVDHLPLADHPHREFLLTVLDDALTRLLLPSLEREVRRELTEIAQEHAVAIFAKNLRGLLLQQPLRGKRLLAIDPGVRTGCKVAALGETGELLEDAVIYPHAPKNDKAGAKSRLEELIRKHQLTVIAIGNGTACRDTEMIVAELIEDLEAGRTCILPPTPPPPPPPTPPPVNESQAVPSTTEPLAVSEAPASTEGAVPVTEGGAEATPPAASPEASSPEAVAAPPEPVATVPVTQPIAAASMPELPPAPSDLKYIIVNEAGASVYSASPIGKEEFPNLDATTRGTISIGRRLQDPLSELVKIDPQHVGVGLYQHDIRAKHLKESLESVVESCVNHVGVDLNTASVPLLRHVSGLTPLVAQELVEYRKQHGSFRRREQLLQVPGLGEKRYEQAAGFLKILDGDEPLDVTAIHPESYVVARQLLAELGYSPNDLRDRAKVEELRGRLQGLSPEEVAQRLQVGPMTLRDILDALAKPGRDPREDLPPPVFRKNILKLEDLQTGMELKGTVLNVVPFGAFVDVGLKDSGLIHISQMANRYIKSPFDVVSVGDVVTVWVLEVKPDARRVSLTLIPPHTERRPTERRPSSPPSSPGAPSGDRPPYLPRGPRPGGSGPRGPRPGGAPTGRSSGPPRDRPASPPAPAAGPPSSESRPRPERRPSKPRPLPTLSQAAKEGKAALRTFGELEAFFKTRDGSETEPAPAASPATESVPPSVTEQTPEKVSETPLAHVPEPTQVPEPSPSTTASEIPTTQPNITSVSETPPVSAETPTEERPIA